MATPTPMERLKELLKKDPGAVQRAYDTVAHRTFEGPTIDEYLEMFTSRYPDLTAPCDPAGYRVAYKPIRMLLTEHRPSPEPEVLFDLLRFLKDAKVQGFAHEIEGVSASFENAA